MGGVRMSVSFTKNMEVKETLELISSKTGIPASTIVIRALKTYFYMHEDAIKERKFEKFFSDFIESKKEDTVGT